jgi:hypothetical protein
MLELQDVLASKQIKSSCSLAELTVEEGIVVRLPVNLSDVEVAGRWAITGGITTRRSAIESSPNIGICSGALPTGLGFEGT